MQLILSFDWTYRLLMDVLDFQHSLLPWIGKTAKLMGIYVSDTLRQHGLDLTKEQLILLKLLHERDGLM